MDKNAAFEILKSFVENTDDVIAKDAILALHPELVESEDERIRKHIIDIIKDNAKLKCIPCDAEIAYLEKQKGYSFAFDKESYKSAIKKGWDYYVTNCDKEHSLNRNFINPAYDKGFRDGYRFGVHEEKPLVWTTHDESVREEAISCLEKWGKKFNIGGVDYDNILSWLKEDLSMHKEKQNPVELSEDERIRKALLRCCDDWERGQFGCFSKEDIPAIRAYLERQKVQKSSECKCTNDESEYDKGYIEGHRFGLKQTQEYMLTGGKTFSGLIPCWVNAPSELQPAHKYHGKNVVIMHENNGGFRCVCIDDEKPITFHLPEDTLFVEGWRKKPAEWSKEDKKYLNLAINIVASDFGEDSPTVSWLKSLRSQPHWKPSEKQMDALAWYSGNSDVPPTGDKAIKSLYNDLSKL